MPRKRRILREHIFSAALELMKDEGFKNFTARRIAEYLNASTQPIYKEFSSMDDLKLNLLVYFEEYLQNEVFKVSTKGISLGEICGNYICFAKAEGTLFSALYMDKELPARAMHDISFQAINTVMDQSDETSMMDSAERKDFIDIFWAAIHGTAILTAQGQFDLSDKEIEEKACRIVTHSLAVWEKLKIA